MNTSFKSALLVLLLAVCSLQVRYVIAQASVLTEEEYWALVQESRARAAQLENESDEEILKELDQLAARWEAVTDVNVGGQSLPVDHQYLTEIMRADPPDLDRLEKTLASLLDARLGAPAEAFSSADLVPLVEILARPEFQWAEAAPNPAAEWLQRIITEINRWLNELLGVTFDVASSDMVSIIMAILLVVVFVFVFRALFSDFFDEAKMSKEGGAEEPLTSEAALAKAQQLSRGGDYRSAVRYLYLSTLLILDERGIMRYDRSKTNREYLRGVAKSPELSAPLGEVIEVFDNVWYGHHSLEEESFQHYSKRVEELKEKQS